MRNKVGQDAFIKNGTMVSNIGRRVQVVSYIGYFIEGETFEYNGMTMAVPATDHFFWIFSATGIDTPMGETSKAYAPDSWLEPIKPDDGVVKTTTKELEQS